MERVLFFGFLGDLFKILLNLTFFLRGTEAKQNNRCQELFAKESMNVIFWGFCKLTLFQISLCPIQVAFQAVAALNRPLAIFCQRALCAMETLGVFRTYSKALNRLLESFTLLPNQMICFWSLLLYKKTRNLQDFDRMLFVWKYIGVM